MQKLIPASQASAAFSRGSLPAGMLGQAMQGVRQSSLSASASPPDPPPAQFISAASPQWPAAEVNRSCSAPMRRMETAEEAAARRVSMCLLMSGTVTTSDRLHKLCITRLGRC